MIFTTYLLQYNYIIIFHKDIWVTLLLINSKTVSLVTLHIVTIFIFFFFFSFSLYACKDVSNLNIAKGAHKKKEKKLDNTNPTQHHGAVIGEVVTTF